MKERTGTCTSISREIRTFHSTCTQNSSFILKICFLVNLLQCSTCRFHLCLYHLHNLYKRQPVQSAPIQEHLGAFNGFKSCSTILSCQYCLGKPFGDSKHYP